MNKILFQGRPLILTEGGAITTENDYKRGLQSYAHLYPNGEINRFGRVIGHKEDIGMGEFVEIEGTVEGLLNMLTLDGWPDLKDKVWSNKHQRKQD